MPADSKNASYMDRMLEGRQEQYRSHPKSISCKCLEGAFKQHSQKVHFSDLTVKMQAGENWNWSQGNRKVSELQFSRYK